MELEHLLGKFDLAEETRDGYLATCPAHVDTRPSLVISRKNDGRILINCRSGCDIEDILKAAGLEMRDLFDVKGSGPVIENQDAPLSVGDRAALALYLTRAAGKDGTPAEKYASRFGIRGRLFTELGLGYDDGTIQGGKLRLSQGTYHDAPRLVVPFNDFNGNPHYLQSRAIDDYQGTAKWSGPINPQNSTWGKYGYFNGGTGWDEVIITEGPGDALTAVAVGYDVVAIRGAGLAANSQLMDEVSEGIRARRVIVAGDSDEAGQKFTQEIASALSERGLNVHRLIIPASDLTAWHETVQDFPTALKRAVASAPKYDTGEVLTEIISNELALLNDVENARALHSLIDGMNCDVRFTPEVGWLVYRPEHGVWREDKSEWLRQMAQRVLPNVQMRALAKIAEVEQRVVGLTDTAQKNDLNAKIKQARDAVNNERIIRYTMSRQGIDAMLRELQALPDVFASITDFDLHSRFLAVGNGVVDLETGELKAYGTETKEMYLTRKVEIDYDPNARNPRWEQFLKEIFPDNPELPPYIQRLVGYGITGYTSEQCFAVLWGNGANGKSVLTEVIATLFGPISVTTSFSTFEAKRGGGIPNDVAALKGARLVMASEGNRNVPMDEATIKKLTGDGIVQARFMRQEFFEFTPTFLILLATNYKPDFRGQDDGLWRRVKLIPFKRFFKDDERDGYLASKFVGREVPRFAWSANEDFGDGPKGILSWAIAGAIAYFAEGLNDPDVVKVATSDYRIGADALNGFVGDVVVLDSEGKISGKDLWDAYQTWCEDEGMPMKDRWRRATVWNAIEERGASRKVSGRAVYFRGVRRLTPEDSAGTVDVVPFEAK